MSAEDKHGPPEERQLVHRVKGGVWRDDDLYWETACGDFIRDCESEGRVVPPNLARFNEGVSCEECQAWLGLLSLRCLNMEG